LKRKRLITGYIPLTFILALSVHVSVSGAAVPVEELGGGTGTRVTSTPVNTKSTPTSSASDDPYYRLQILQEELRQLRGMLEEQANELALLKKRQREDYIDLDGRLSSSSRVNPASNSSPNNVSGVIPGGTSPQLAPQLDPANNPSVTSHPAGVIKQTPRAGSKEQAAYNQAYGFLKARKIPEAKAALKKFLLDYPQGPYAANAHYWLGEVYLLNSEFPEATTEFLAVVEQYPRHRKVNDATFKLGKVYHLQNEPEKARVLLQRIAQGSDSSARLAQDYLSRYF
jgi:tol-pal system protein YbgF